LTQPKLASPAQSSTPVDTEGVSDQFESAASSNASATGKTGLWAESIAGKNAFQQIMDRDPAAQQDSQLNSALQSLHHIIKSVQQVDPPNAWTTMSSLNAANVAPLPAWPEAKAVLERAERRSFLANSLFRLYLTHCLVQKPMTVNLLSPALYADFCQKCQSIYENGLEGSIADKMLVYSGLSDIGSEVSGASNGTEAEHNHKLSIAFFHLLCEAMATLPARIPASMATLEAVFAAVSLPSYDQRQ
jgi:hypothetical protein